MTAWTNDELEAIGSADELEIASNRRDGTLRRARTIWVVRVGDNLYVRSVNGRESDWFRGVLTLHQGRIQAGGVDKDVIFSEDIHPSVHAQIDAAYLTKYANYPKQYVDACLTPAAKSATIKLVPN